MILEELREFCLGPIWRERALEIENPEFYLLGELLPEILAKAQLEGYLHRAGILPCSQKGHGCENSRQNGANQEGRSVVSHGYSGLR